MKDNFFLKVDVKTILREDAGDFIFEGVATTSNPDREHDILEHKGAFFADEVPLLMHHAQNLPVGVVRLFRVDEGIRYVARISNPAGDETDFGSRRKSAIAQIKSGVIRGVSIGYLPQPGSVKRLTPVGRRISRFEIVELSLVSVPANRDATIREIKSIFKGNQPQTAKEKKTLNLAQMIADRKTSIETKNARILEIVGEVETSGATFTEAQTEEFESLGAEVKSIEADVARLEMALEIDKKSAKVIDSNPGSKTPRTAPVQVKTPKTGEKGTGFARFAMVVAAGKGNLMQSEKLAETYFPNDEELNTSIKAAVAAGTTTDATWAAPLVDSYQRFAGDFVEFLRPQTIIGKFGVGGIPSLRRVPFNIEIPGQITGGEGYWVGEGAPKPLTKFDFENITLRWNKVANIAVLTQELIRFSDPAAEVLVRDALAAALLERLDRDFIDPTKAANGNVSPASITNGVTPIPSSGNDVDAVNADIAAVMGAFITANNTPQTGVWIMSSVRALALSLMKEPLGNRAFPDISMNGGTFAGLPVIVSQYVANDTVILVNAGDVLLADDGGVSIDSSRETSLQMDNAPTNNSGTPTATQVVSMFQTNSVALRAERYITWRRRRPSGVQVLTGVAWGSPTTP